MCTGWMSSTISSQHKGDTMRGASIVPWPSLTIQARNCGLGAPWTVAAKAIDRILVQHRILVIFHLDAPSQSSHLDI